MFNIKSVSRIFPAVLVATWLAFSGVGLLPAHAQAGATWYVANTGIDSNTCSDPSAPCLTINGALGKAANIDGDTIKVAAGTYTGSDTLGVVVINKSITLSGGWDASFSSQNGTSIIDGQQARRGIVVGSTYFVTGTASVDRFTIENGLTTYGDGGGIACFNGALNLSNSIVSNSVSINGGGGIANNCSPMIINNTTVTGSSGILNGNTMVLNNSLVSMNSRPAGYLGGGIYNSYGAMLTLNNSTVSGNMTEGIYVYSSSSVTLNNSTISGNLNGGVLIDNGNLAVNNSTVSGNTGFGLSQSSGTTTVSNSTISANTVGIMSSNDSDNGTGTLTLQNSILAGNTQDCQGDAFTSASYNLFGNISGCNLTTTTGDLTNVDPLFGPLTGSPAYLPLLNGSPAIDAGNPAVPGSGGTACLATDQRGVTRPQGSACDIGAYEWAGHSISGNAGVGGAKLSYHDGTDRSVVADDSGNYSLKVVDGWAGVVTPSRLGFSFSPASIDYSAAPGPVTSDLTGQDYTAVRTGYGISGNAGVAGATLSYNDGSPHTATSDSQGNYGFSVPFNWSGTVTPSKVGTRFVPVKRVYTNVTADMPAENYTAYITVPVPNAPAGTILVSRPTYKWTVVPGATQYQYQLLVGARVVYSKTVRSIVCKGSACSNTPTGALASGTYKWRIRAFLGGVWKSYSAYKSFTILVPSAGFWEGDTGFYVTPARTSVVRYAMYIKVPQCGIYNRKLVSPAVVPIVNAKFNHTGYFYYSGTFTTAKINKGIVGLDNYYIRGCGAVSGGPFATVDLWKNSSQALSPTSETFTLTVVVPTAGDSFTFYELKLVNPFK